jgi:hypothetical protein
MNIDKALLILAQVHTRDDRLAGFVVEMGASPYASAPWISQADYIDAWKTVREHLHLPTEPENA